MGRQGALLVTETSEYLHPAFPVEADRHDRGRRRVQRRLAFAFARGAEQGDAMRYAAATAPFSVTRAGAKPSMPSRADGEALIGAGGGWNLHRAEP